MAVTVEDLIADIEKRMKDLGYEDFENLYSPDHDLQSLKQLKRKIMDEAKALRDEKKERSKHTKALRDFLVKISKVYKKDMYIYNGVFVIPGKISEESLKGRFILSVKEEFQISIKNVLFPDSENKVIFIRDLSELKNIIDENIENKDIILPRAEELKIIDVYDYIKTSIIKDKMDSELQMIQSDSELFEPLVIDESDPDVLNLKKIFNIEYKDFPPIEANIQLFPFYAEKEKPFIEFMCGNFENKGRTKLYYARFHVDYTYFDIYFKIYFF